MLIDKNKGLETDINLYRPVGLANTMYRHMAEAVSMVPEL